MRRFKRGTPNLEDALAGVFVHFEVPVLAGLSWIWEAIGLFFVRSCSHSERLKAEYQYLPTIDPILATLPFPVPPSPIHIFL